MNDLNRKKYLTIEELCQMLQVKKHYVYALTSAKKIPFIKVGRFVRFDPSQILEWVHSKTQKVEDYKNFP